MVRNILSGVVLLSAFNGVCVCVCVCVCARVCVYVCVHEREGEKEPPGMYVNQSTVTDPSSPSLYQ